MKTFARLAAVLALAAAPVLGAAQAQPRAEPGRRAASRVPAVGVAVPASPEERAALVEAYLSAIDRVVPPEAWRALGPEAALPLAAAADDPATLPSRRAAALQGLSALGGARAEAAHLAALRAEGTPRLVRLAAVRGLGRLLAPPRLHAELAPSLDAADGGIRRMAADVLSERAPAEACPAIRARAAREGPGGGPLAPAAARCR